MNFLFTFGPDVAMIKQTYVRKEVRGLEKDPVAEAKLGEQFPVNIPIQMMCVTDTTGRMNPIRFKYESEEHEIVTIPIVRIVARDERNFVGIREKQFICSVVMDGIYRTVEIRYSVESQKWRIFQILS